MKIINFQPVVSRINSFGFSAVIISLLTFTALDVSAHGYVTSPKSRVLVCNENNPETPTLPACIAAKAAGNIGFYSPQSIAIGGVKDNHEQVIPDGKLCSAGVSGYEGLDLARNDWVATRVQPGPQEFVWTNTAQHKTMYFRYYITKQGFNPGAAPLKWSDLEQIYQSNPTGQEANSRHTVPLPQRTGKHIVYSIWQRDYSDAPEGFYQCIDVDFSSGNSSSVAVSSSAPSSISSSSKSASSINGDTCASLPAWDANTIYNKPQQVKYNNKRYQANYWTQGNNPELTSGQYNYWLDLGACVTSGSSQSSVVASSSVQSSLVRSSLSSSSLINSSSSKSSVASSVASSCTSPAYVNGATYATGALVQNAGSEYRCTVGGWCTVGGPYAPGTGWAWTNAWVVTRTCQ